MKLRKHQNNVHFSLNTAAARSNFEKEVQAPWVMT
jgi:hypothetical protein